MQPELGERVLAAGAVVLKDMVLLPEWAACNWSGASGLRERGTRGLSPQRMRSTMIRRL